MSGLSGRRPFVVCLASLVLIAACTAAPGTGNPASSALAPSAPPASGPADAPSVAASAAASAPTSAGRPAVDLTFSGTTPFTAKGSVGRCIVIGTGADTRFGFEATEAEYPGLGLSFSLAELNAGVVDLKWALSDGKSAYSFQPGSTATLSSDHHSVQLDADLAPMSTPGTPKPGPEHVTGSVTCP